jgi:hypothetical protein
MYFLRSGVNVLLRRLESGYQDVIFDYNQKPCIFVEKQKTKFR